MVIEILEKDHSMDIKTKTNLILTLSSDIEIQVEIIKMQQN